MSRCWSYAESGLWPQPFAPHDLGSAYPVASGHNDGGGENMPVEETGNMLIMAAAYMQQAPGPGAAFATAHYTISSSGQTTWTANLPDPGYQNQTDDFAGLDRAQRQPGAEGNHRGRRDEQDRRRWRAHAADAASYRAQAQQFISYWVTHAQDPSAAAPGPDL